MVAHKHSRETLRTSAQQRTSSGVLAAPGYACSSAATTSACCARGGTERRQHATQVLPAFRVRHIVYICTHVGSAARINKLVKETHTHKHISDAYGLNCMIAHMHSRGTLPTPAPQRTRSHVLAASGCASSSAATTSGPAWFSAA